MRRNVDISEDEIIRCLREAYGLSVNRLLFLPLGADFNTIVYRVTISDGVDYFLKLRSGEFLDFSVMIPGYLVDQGLKQVIPPITTRDGRVFTQFGAYCAALYPYIEGCNGVEAKLTESQWVELGRTVKTLHSSDLPESIGGSIPRESFSLKWCEKVREFLVLLDGTSFNEAVAAEMASFLKEKRSLIMQLVERVESLGPALAKESVPYVLCHADMHGWNLLIDERENLYLIDWDTLILAPKERDLMFVGAGIHDTGRTQREEELLFYKGYGDTEVNRKLIAYYRYARIVEDIGEYCQVLFEGGNDNEALAQYFEYLKSNFQKDGTIDRARASTL